MNSMAAPARPARSVSPPSRRRWLVLRPLPLGLFALTMVGGRLVHGAEITASQREFFESKIRPVLVAECYECHAGKTSKGGLRVDSRADLLKGGDNGPTLIPGEPGRSLLVESLAHRTADADLYMPKNGAKVEESILKDFITWIQMGAPDPRETAEVTDAAPATWDQAFALRRQWWSFQPLASAAPPLLPNMDKHPVDAFVDAKLQEVGLTPAPQADRRTLLRRLSFTLTGLPPRVEDMEDFLADESPQAWEKMVDRYLASPAYGETWARHWMDLMRYAETHGSEGDPAIPFAWRYRDHLIRSFNGDVPYDQMVREHIAGDLLPQPRWDEALDINESLLATANLRLVDHGFQPVDSLDEQVKMVDNQIDVLTKSFLGLTVSCARCHDHKFDAISQKDYFALYGILASTRPGQRVIDREEKLTAQRDELITLKQQIRTALADHWIGLAEDVPALLKGPSDREQSRRAIQIELAQLKGAARSAVLSGRGHQVPNHLPQPIAWWTFDEDARDEMNSLPLTLKDGAVIRDGHLILNGTDAYAMTPPLVDDLAEKTLEAWVTLDDLNQQGGGVVTVESGNGAIFDALVFGEKWPRRWLSGSNNHRRTADVGGAEETQVFTQDGAASGWVHLMVTYGRDRRVTLYRNGVPYGQSYEIQEDLPVYAAGQARILLGRRHTGGGRAFLKGRIDEARVYARALSAAEVAASYHAGVTSLPDAQLLAALTPAQRARWAELQTLQQEAAATAKTPQASREAAWATALRTARKDATSALYPWAALSQRTGPAFAQGWAENRAAYEADRQQRQAFNAQHFTRLWDLRGKDYEQWSRHGVGLEQRPAAPGEFRIEPTGKRVVTGILPAGVYSHLLSSKQGALLTSPFFKLAGSSLSARMTGDDGGGLRIVIDNYPLGNNETYPQYRPDGEGMRWVRLDTDYRKDSRAYLEMATYDDLTRPQRSQQKAGQKDVTYEKGRSWFGLSEVMLHKDAQTEPPREEVLPVSLVWEAAAISDADALAHRLGTLLGQALQAWKAGTLTPPQQAYLDAFVSQGLLPSEEAALPAPLQSLIKRYRDTEAQVPVPQRAPGALEGDGYDAPLMVRGDHHQLGEIVPRGFLQVLSGGQEFRTRQGSQRLALAQAMTRPDNPLLTRVWVNRVWHWLYGRGLVATVDNFGRLGEKPSHPELLDWLATQFAQEHYSTKDLIRLLVTSAAWQRSSVSPPGAQQKDATNQYLSHRSVQRLEAEMIRDAMLQVSGVLNPQMYGEPVGTAQYRRSVYLVERRTAPQPFLEVFDRPNTTTTRGQRDATNTPAQSLTLMNDPYVIRLAERWAKQLPAVEPEARVDAIYRLALARPASPEELSAAREYLGPQPDVAAWRDYLQAIFSLKEFIYLR